MHMFISDTHMTDQRSGSAVSDEELVEFAGKLERLANVNGKVDLVIVGDGVDLIRSRKWVPSAYPWSATVQDFKNFVDGPAEVVAIRVLQDIRKRYQNFERKLGMLVTNHKLKVHYVFGNHDYMIQLSPKLRHELVEFLSLAHDPSQRFSRVYKNDELSVYAEHGHVFDTVNWHDEDRGLWALGDAIVLLVVNSFTERAISALNTSHDTLIGRMLNEIDNVSPKRDVPVFVRWLADNYLTSSDDRAGVLDAWKTVVNTLLSDKKLRFKSREDDAELVFARTALRLSTYQKLVQLLNHVKIDPTADDYRQRAEELATALGKYRYILLGHTHTPKMIPLQHRVGNHPCYYVNTGCWRRVWVRPDRTKAGPFVSTRIQSYFQIGETADECRFVHHESPAK